MKKLLAYKLHSDDEEGHAEVHFFYSRNAAKKYCAGLWGVDYMEARVTRAPDFDDLQGTPTERDYIERGWWFECGECGKHVEADMDSTTEDDEGNEIPCDGPAFDEHENAYCSTGCRDAAVEACLERRRLKADAINHIGQIIPCVTNIRTFNGGFGVCTEKCFDKNRNNISVEFNFPGQQWDSVHYCHGCKTFWLHPEDQPLFHTFKRGKPVEHAATT